MGLFIDTLKKDIKYLVKIYKEDRRKEKAKADLIKQMTPEEYRAFKGACEIVGQRKSYIEYSKSRCTPEEYSMRPQYTSVEIVDRINKSKGVRKVAHTVDYLDTNVYKVSTDYAPSINEREYKLNNSKDVTIINNLINKYS